jgi:CheY-like chemotaxis protein
MDGQITAHLAGAWTRHAETQTHRITVQERSIVKLLASTLDEDDQRLAAAEAHKLAGILGSFGLEEGSQLAAELEQAWSADDPWSLDAAALARSVSRLRRVVEAYQPPADEVLDATRSAGDGGDVLLVDDDDAFAAYVQATLQAQAQVSWLPDGAAALKAVSGEHPTARPRLILLDIEMPGIDGLDVLEQLAERGVTRECRVVMLTRRTLAEDIMKARKLGAFDFLAKPLSASLLVDRVTRALEPAQ